MGNATASTTQQEAVTKPEKGQKTPVTVARKGQWGVYWVFPHEEGRLDVLSKAETLVGTVQDPRQGDIRLEGPSGPDWPLASRRHATITEAKHGNELRIRDEGSTNGVWVNGERLGANENRGLCSGDVIRLGEFVGVVQRFAGEETSPVWEFQSRPLTMRLTVYVDLGEGKKKKERLDRTYNVVTGPVTQRAFAMAESQADSDFEVVLLGETGTGKEFVAMALHAWGKRTNGPYVALNCSELRGDAGLAKARLFGVEPGGYTGAVQTKGAFRSADKGTLLLDEIVDLPLDVQAMLLRALDQKVVVPVGGNTPIAVDVRLIAAAQRPLDREVAQGRFRSDLWERLNGYIIPLPPLRERKAEIAHFFLSSLRGALGQSNGPGPVARFHVSEVEPALVEHLCRFAWPGNVRQLSRLARYLRAKESSGDFVPATDGLHYRFLKEHLPATYFASPTPDLGPNRKDAEDLKHLVEAIRKQDGSLELAVNQLDMDWSDAYSLARKWDALIGKHLPRPANKFERNLKADLVDAAALSALVDALRRDADTRGLDVSQPARDFKVGDACKSSGIERSRGYRLFKRWSALVDKGLLQKPRDELEHLLFERFARG